MTQTPPLNFNLSTLTPVPVTPVDTWSGASAALKRLDELRTLLARELDALPRPGEALLSALEGTDVSERELEIFSLLQQIDDYWSAPGETGETRRDRLVAAVQRALHDEARVRIHERDLDSGYLACLPESPDQAQDSAPACSTVRVQLHDDEQIEMAGVLVISEGQGRTLLMLPGLGITGFATQAMMITSAVTHINNFLLRVVAMVSSSTSEQGQKIVSLWSSSS